MKKRRVIIFLILFIFISINFVIGVLNNNEKNVAVREDFLSSKIKTQEVQLKGNVMSFDYYFPEPKIGKVKINNKIFDRVFIDDLEESGKPGEPVLPFKTVKILLPQNAKVSGIKVEGIDENFLPENYYINPGQKPYPLLLNVNASFTNPDSLVYSSFEPYFKEPNGKENTGKLAGYNILYVNLYPVNYVPASGKLSYHKKINVKVSYTSSGILKKSVDFLYGEKDNFRDLKEDKERVEKLVDNPLQVSNYKKQSAPLLSNVFLGLTGRAVLVDPSQKYDYLIITNTEFKNYNGAYGFNDLLNKKKEKGLSATIVSIEDIYSQYSGKDEQEKIRNFIKDAYLNWNTKYVLLGGDADGANVSGESGNNIIPVRKLWVKPYETNNWDLIPSDVYYSNLDGDFDYNNNGIYGEKDDGEDSGEVDLYAEVYVGRAPVDSIVELQNFVRKTIIYEDAIKNNEPWLKKALMVGEDLGWSTASIYKDEIKDGSSNYGYTTEGFPPGYDLETLYDLVKKYGDPVDYKWQKTQIINKINSNLNIINHLGHASTCYSLELCNAPQSGGGYCSGSGLKEIDNLNNDKPVFIYSQGCYSGSFDNWNYNGYYTTSDSAAEHFVTSNNGGFAVIMNSRYGWGLHFPDTNSPSQIHDRKFFDAVFGKGITQLGKANAYAKAGLIDYINDENCLTWSDCVARGIYWETNLLGDPEISLYVPPKPNHNLKLLSIKVPEKIIAEKNIEINSTVVNNGLSDENNVKIDFFVNNILKESKVVSEIKSKENADIKFNWIPEDEGMYNLVVQINPVSGEEIINDNNKSVSKKVISTEISYPASILKEGVLDYRDYLDIKREEIIPTHKNILDIKGSACGKNFDHYEIKLCRSDKNRNLYDCSNKGLNIINNGSLKIIDNVLATLNLSIINRSEYYMLILSSYKKNNQTNYSSSFFYIDTELKNNWPQEVPDSSTLYYFTRQPTIQDVDGDGKKDIIIANGENVYAYMYNGSFLSGFPVKANSSVIYGPAVADVNNDGDNEIVFGDYRGDLYIIKKDGSNLNGWPKKISYGGIFQVSLGDINNDGYKEIIAGDNNGNLHVLNISGKELEGWPKGTSGWCARYEPDYPHSITFSSIADFTISVADVNNDGNKEIISNIVRSGGYDYLGYPTTSCNSINILDSRGNILSGWPKPYLNPYYEYYESDDQDRDIKVADLDMDGSSDIIFSEFNLTIHALNYKGEELKGFPFKINKTKNFLWMGSPIVGDLDNDGILDIAISSYQKPMWGSIEDINSCMYLFEYFNSNLSIKNGFPICSPERIHSYLFKLASLGGNSFNYIFTPNIFYYPDWFYYDFFIFGPDGTLSKDKKMISGGRLFAVDDIDGDGVNDLVVLGDRGYKIYINVWNISGNSNKNEWPVNQHDSMHTGNYNFGKNLGEFNPPKVSLINPINKSSVSNSLINLFGRFSDDSNLKNSTLYIWNSSGKIAGLITNNINGRVNFSNLTYSLLNYGKFYWNYYVCDDSSKCSWANENLSLNFSSCVPKSCSSLNKQCGNWNDGCGGILQCGICPYGIACNSTGVCCSSSTPTGYLCFPKYECGVYDYGCGKIKCGDCIIPGQVCKYGRCVFPCIPNCTNKECGSDKCDGNCGTCALGYDCNSSGKCFCNPKNCSQLGIQCGNWSDNCGKQINCGGCYSGQSCNSGGKCMNQGGLVAYYSFDGNMNDSSGNNNHGNCSGASCPTLVSGKIGQAYGFDGINDYIEVNKNNLNINGSLTISAWIKPSGSMNGSKYYNILAKESLYSNGYVLDIYGKNNWIEFRTRNGTISSLTYSPLSNMNDTWTHVVGVFDGSNSFLYIKGVLVKTSQGIPAGLSIYPLRIGYSGKPQIGDSYFNGTIDEVKIWSKFLSSDEVFAEYQRGTNCISQCLGKQCGDDGCGKSCGNCSSGQTCNSSGQCVCTANCSGKACGDSDGCNGWCNIACNDSNKCTTDSCSQTGCVYIPIQCPAGQICDSNTGNCVSSCIPKICLQLGKQCGNWSDECGRQIDCGICPSGQTCNSTGQCVSQNLGLAAYYSFEGNTNDATGNGNNGIVNGSTLTTGKIGQAYSFDGINDYIEVPKEKLNINGPLTVSAWIKPTGNMAGLKYYNILAKESIYSSGYGIEIYGSKPWIEFWTRNSNRSCGAYWGYLNISNINDKWTHVTGVFDGTYNKIYIDGVLKKTVAGTTPYSSGLYPLRIGYSGKPYIDTYFNGTIDEVKIWNKALNNSEIKSEYDRASTCISNCSGKACGDSDGCNGWCNIACNDNNKCTSDSCSQTGCVYTSIQCPAGQSCDSNTGNCVSSCNPKTCQELGKQCDLWDNGCGTQIDCGNCSSGQTCNSTGQCVCTANCSGKTCGDSDGCGGWCNIVCNDNNKCTIDSCSQTGCVYTPIQCPTEQTCDSNTGNCVSSQTGSYAYYPFEGNMNDISGNNRHGSCSGNSCPVLVSGKIGQAYSFNGINNSILVSPEGDFRFTDNITISAWVNLADNKSINRQPLFDKYSYGGYQAYFLQGKLIFTWGNSSGSSSAGMVKPISINEWHFVAASFSKGNVIIYIDGVLNLNSTTNTLTRPVIGIVTQAPQIGSSNTKNFNGTIDELKIWNRVLTPQEIMNEYNRGQGQLGTVNLIKIIIEWFKKFFYFNSS